MKSFDLNNIKTSRKLSNKELAKYISKQLNYFFPDDHPVSEDELENAVSLAEERAFYCFSNIRKKYFNDKGVTHFNHLISDQYCMYLYMLANYYHIHRSEEDLPTKLYLLNKALHGVDIFYTTMLPDIFLLVHPIGTILGRANYSDYFIAYQGVTVGCLNEGVFPSFEGRAILYANSSVLGKCTIGNNVCLSAGSAVINKNVEENCIVFGSGTDLTFKPNNKTIEERPPFIYGN